MDVVKEFEDNQKVIGQNRVKLYQRYYVSLTLFENWYWARYGRLPSTNNEIEDKTENDTVTVWPEERQETHKVRENL